MALNQTQRFAYRIYGRPARASGWLLGALERSLPKAHRFVRADVYLATVYLKATVVLLWGHLSALAFHLLLDPTGAARIVTWTAPGLATLLYLVLVLLGPVNHSLQRRKHLDARLPYALNYISTMASAGMPPEKIFWSLSKQTVYGEVAREAALISRDLRGLGLDLRTAFQNAIERSPSRKMAAFLQGAITTLATGDDLAHYFLVKSQQFSHENRNTERQFLDNLGVLAESYVTLVVAAPIFILVLLSVMIVFGSGAERILALGYVLILVLIPTAQAVFAATLETMTPEV